MHFPVVHIEAFGLGDRQAPTRPYSIFLLVRSLHVSVVCPLCSLADPSYTASRSYPTTRTSSRDYEQILKMLLDAGAQKADED